METATKTQDSQRRSPRLEVDPETGEEFYVYEDVPVLRAHVDDDGVDYDEKLLTRITENNNRRIEDTDDYTPIVAWHTSDDGDPDKDPPIIGYAGPFRMGKVGKRSKQPCIFARFRIPKDHHKIFKARPRRSVEIWPEKKPEDRWIDPIALLGAQTPRQDLGLIRYHRYSKKPPEGVEKLRYQWDGAFASGMNTHIPGLVGGDDEPAHPDQLAKEPSKDRFTPEQLQQLLEALKPSIMAWIDESNVHLTPEPPGEGADLMNEPTIPDVGPPLGDEDMAFPQGVASRFMKRYAKGDDFDCDGARDYMAKFDEDDLRQVQRYMKHHADDATRRQYAQCFENWLGEEEGREPEPSSANKYRKERDELKSRYAKLERDHRDLKKVVDEIKEQNVEEQRKARYAKRHAALTELSSQEGYMLDADEEMEFCGDFTDELFDKHLDRIRVRYERVGSPAISAVARYAKSEIPARKVSDEKRERYSKAARERTLRLREQGHSVEYKDVLGHMLENDTDTFVPEKNGAV